MPKNVIRTTVVIPAPIYRRLKEQSARQGCSVRDLVIHGIERVLLNPQRPRRKLHSARSAATADNQNGDGSRRTDDGGGLGDLRPVLPDERIAFLPEPQGIDPRLRTFASSQEASPKLWADAYLAAFQRGGVEICHV